MFLLRKFLIFFLLFCTAPSVLLAPNHLTRLNFFTFLTNPAYQFTLSVSTLPFPLIILVLITWNHSQWRNQERDPGGPAPPYFKTKLKKICRPPPSPFSNGLYDRPPPLISRSASGTDSGLAVPHWDNSVLRNFLCARNNSNWVPCVISSLIIIYISFPNEGGGCWVSLRLLTWRRYAKKKIPLEEREGYTMIRLGDNRNSRIAWIKKTFYN